jgi:hypothetical protein
MITRHCWLRCSWLQDEDRSFGRESRSLKAAYELMQVHTQLVLQG